MEMKMKMFDKDNIIRKLVISLLYIIKILKLDILDCIYYWL